MTEPIRTDEGRVDPWAAYANYDWNGSAHQPPPVQKGTPPGPLYDTHERMSPIQDGSTRKTERFSRSMHGGPRLSPPKVTAQPNTREWYQQMTALANDKRGTIGLSAAGDDDIGILRGFFEVCAARKSDREEMQRTSADSIMKNQDVNKKLKKEMDESADASKDLGWYRWASDWLSTLLKGAMFVVAGITLMTAGTAIASGVGVVTALGTAAGTSRYVNAALMLATAFATASKRLIDDKTNKHKQDQEEIKFKMEKQKGKTSSDLKRMKTAEEANARDQQLKQQMLKNHRQAAKMS